MGLPRAGWPGDSTINMAGASGHFVTTHYIKGVALFVVGFEKGMPTMPNVALAQHSHDGLPMAC